MTSPKPAWATPKHNPQNPSEVARMKAEWGARREFLLASRRTARTRRTTKPWTPSRRRMRSAWRTAERRTCYLYDRTLIRDSMRRETLINDRCDRVNTMRRKQSFEAVTKFGKVVSGQDMDATIDMKRHDSNFTRRTSPEDGRPRGPVVVGANWRGRRPGTTVGGASTCDSFHRRLGCQSCCHSGARDEDLGHLQRLRPRRTSFGRLWDLVSFEAAATCMRSVDDPQKAAHLLCEKG